MCLKHCRSLFLWRLKRNASSLLGLFLFNRHSKLKVIYLQLYHAKRLGRNSLNICNCLFNRQAHPHSHTQNRNVLWFLIYKQMLTKKKKPLSMPGSFKSPNVYKVAFAHFYSSIWIPFIVCIMIYLLIKRMWSNMIVQQSQTHEPVSKHVVYHVILNC